MNGLIQAQERCLNTVAIHRASLKETLRDQKVYHEDRLNKINQALEALEKYPEFTACLEVIQQAM